MPDQQVRPDDNLEYQEAGTAITGSDVGRPQAAIDALPQEQTRNTPEESQEPYNNSPLDKPVGEDPPGGSSLGSVPNQAATDGSSDEIENTAWLIQKAHEIYNSSTDYLDANITNQWETNLHHFNSQHAPGSNFNKKNFKRSRIFRPKTRSSVKAQEAALAAAAFSTQDLLLVRAENEDDEVQRLSAQINKSILQYRLSRRMPWFQTVMGAWQCTKVYGICISHQFWRYEEDTDWVPALDTQGKLIVDDEGYALGNNEPVVRVDELVCDLIAPENFRFDPMCDWRDPARTSPFLIYLMPIYAGEAQEMMEMEDKKTGRKPWIKYSLGEILGTRRQDYDRTRQAREGRERIDPADEQHGNSFTTVWAHMNIIKVNGTDIVYWTMGTELLLTKPVLLTKLYPHLMEGERPFRVGTSTIEAFRNYPAGDVEQGANLQEEINTIANSRVDNVKLVLNKRYYVKRGAQVDLEALIRNVPGGGVMMADPEGDVKTIDTPDITKSSYEETDRLSVEHDELIGAFSQSSVQSNKALGETVGGMAEVKSSAGAVQDYGITIFMQTWMEPVVRDLTRLVQQYETDEIVLALAVKGSDLWQKYGIDKVTDSLLKQNLTVDIDIGIGNTDPVRRVERLMFGIEKVAGIPGMVDRIKGGQVADEVFGALGYKTSNRFFMDDEEWKVKEEEIMAQQQVPPEIELEQRKVSNNEADTQLRDERERLKLGQEYELRMNEIASKSQISRDQLDQTLGIAQAQDQTKRDEVAAREANKRLEAQNKAGART